MNQKQIEDIQASVNEAIRQARLKVEELVAAIDAAFAAGNFVDLRMTLSEAKSALERLPKDAPRLHDPAVVITCQHAGGRDFRGGSAEDRYRFAQAFADACSEIMGRRVVVQEVHNEYWVEYGEGDNHPLNDMDDAQRKQFDASLTHKGLFVEE